MDAKLGRSMRTECQCIRLYGSSQSDICSLILVQALLTSAQRRAAAAVLRHH